MTTLNEVSLSRVFKHTNADYPIAIFTAFRGDVPREKNIKNNKYCANELRKAGFGFFYVDGYWIENKGKPDERHVSEDSIFAIGTIKTQKKFTDLIIKLGKKFEQDGVLVKNDRKFNIYDKNGNIDFSFNKLSITNLGSVYTKLRNNKKSNTFVFESVNLDVGFIGRLKNKTFKQFLSEDK